MRILLFSDSHGYTQNMQRVLQRIQEVDLVVHLGDFTRDMFALSTQYPRIPYEVIRGNNDWCEELPDEKMLRCEGLNILITHGHLHRVKYGVSTLVAHAREMCADAVFYGHTHLHDEFYVDGTMFLNPGSIGMPVEGEPHSCCLVEVNDRKISSRFINASL